LEDEVALPSSRDERVDAVGEADVHTAAEVAPGPAAASASGRNPDGASATDPSGHVCTSSCGQHLLSRMRWPLNGTWTALERPECAVLAHPLDGPIVRILRPWVADDHAGASRRLGCASIVRRGHRRRDRPLQPQLTGSGAHRDLRHGDAIRRVCAGRYEVRLDRRQKIAIRSE